MHVGEVAHVGAPSCVNVTLVTYHAPRSGGFDDTPLAASWCNLVLPI